MRSNESGPIRVIWQLWGAGASSFRRQDGSPLAEGDTGARESEVDFSGDGLGERDDGSRSRYSGTDLMKEGLGGRGGAVV